MKRLIKIIYIVLFAAEALLVLSAIVFLPMRAERHSLLLYAGFCLTAAVFVTGLLLVNGAADLILTKSRHKKTIAAAGKLIEAQKDFARYIGLLSHAILVDDKLEGKSRLFAQKIRQQTQLISENLTNAALSMKKLN